MFNVKKDTAYVSIILLVLFGAMLGGMEEGGLALLFLIMFGGALWHRNYLQRKEGLEEYKLKHKVKKLGIVFALLLLTACTTTNLQHYTDIDHKDKTITVPAGAKGLKGDIKKALRDAGWTLAVYRGPSVIEGKGSRLEQFDTYNTRYTLTMGSYVCDYCLDFTPAIEYDISLIDNKTGSEVITMDGRGCEDQVTQKFVRALNE